jgi:hypothetical protein
MCYHNQKTNATLWDTREYQKIDSDTTEIYITIG